MPSKKIEKPVNEKSNNNNNNNRSNKKRLGNWIPNDDKILEQFHNDLSTYVKTQDTIVLVPVIQELHDLINNNPVLRMGFEEAINQANTAGYKLGYNNIDELIKQLNALMTYSPPFSVSELVGCPINALIVWLMCMPAGFALFRSEILNAQLKKVLTHWCNFLNSEQSSTFLNTEDPTGWFSKTAFSSGQYSLNGIQYNSSLPHWGFTSWNNFFTRKFLPGARPVADPDCDNIVVNACEASPYNIQSNIKLFDKFWIKKQPYSLHDIFTEKYSKLSQQFEGGTIYQAFLSAYNYHRWHSPVRGKIIEAYNIDGTYYSEAESEGRDPGGPNDSQGYITAVAARAIIIIQCKDEALGIVACVFVGMAEVSSCNISVNVSEEVNKGDELGYFQFGGSTYCLIFQPNVKLDFVSKPPFNLNALPLPVNAKNAMASSLISDKFTFQQSSDTVIFPLNATILNKKASENMELTSNIVSKSKKDESSRQIIKANSAPTSLFFKNQMSIRQSGKNTELDKKHTYISENITAIQDNSSISQDRNCFKTISCQII